MSLSSLLERLDAPEKLRGWAASSDESHAWSECSRGDWLVWIAACSGVPVRPVLRAACDCVLCAVQTMSAGTKPLIAAIDLARLPGSAKACRAAAKQCDRAVAAFPASYRSGVPPGYRAASRAAAWVARAAEGLATAEVRAEARTAEQARAQALAVGIHPDVMARKDPGPARVEASAAPDDPAQEQVAYAVAATAEALAQAAIALAPHAEDRRQRREIRASFAQSLRQQLAAIQPKHPRGHL